MIYETLLAFGFFSVSMAYFTLIASSAWSLPFRTRTKVFKMVFYLLSALSSLGIFFSLLLDEKLFIGLETIHWGIVFVVSQNTIWLFIIGLILDRISKNRDKTQFDRIEDTGVDSNRILTEIELQDQKRKKQDDKREVQDRKREVQDDARRLQDEERSS